MFFKFSEKVFLVTLLIIFSFPALAENFGPSVGEKIPHSLSALDQNNENQSFEVLSGDKGLALFFVRSIDWCPFCQEQLIGLNGHVQEFEDKGYTVVSLSYDSPEKLKKFSAKYDISFTLLSDPNSDIIKAFGILNEEHEPGSFAYGVPHPGIFIVNNDQTIQARYYEDGYRERPSLDMVLGNLK